MGGRLSLFRGSATKTDDKEGSQEVKAEVTPQTPSKPTPIASESGTEDKTESKCQCIDCKCDPCNCSHDRPQEPTSPQTVTNELSAKTGGDPVNDTLVTSLEEMKIAENAETEKPNEVVVAEEPQLVQTESPEEPKPEVPQQEVVEESNPEKSDDNVPSDASPQEVQHTPEEPAKAEEPQTDIATEKKCLCSPCECNPCKCGAHEVHTEAEITPNVNQTEEPAKESPEGQTPPENVSQDESAAPEAEPKSEIHSESTQNAEQIQSEPAVVESVKESAAEADQISADDPQVPEEGCQALVTETNEQ